MTAPLTEIHLMVDLETMATGPTAAIVQIGAVLFDPAGDGPIDRRGYSANVNLTSSALAGMRIDPDTIAWWQRQDPAAQTALLAGAVDLRTALAGLRDFVRANVAAPAGVWSHGAAFDVPILEHAAQLTGVALPWSHREVRDTRTVFWLAGAAGWPDDVPFAEAVKHFALSDATHQVLRVQSALRHLGACNATAAP